MPERPTSIRDPSGGRAGRADLSPRRPKIALYSPDAMGIGQLRRNLLLAQRFVTAAPGTPVLLISGTRESGAFPVVTGVDCLTIPALEQRDDGTHGARRLLIDSRCLRELRARTIRAALGTFRPDVLIVDRSPRGVLGELDETLAELRSVGSTRIVLGLADVLDAPGAVRAEWARSANEAVIARYYDSVWVYGDPNVYDPVREYGFGRSVVSRLAFTGYLDPRFRTSGSERPDEVGDPADPRLVLCQVGGGRDGDRLAEAFARTELPSGARGLILTGPFMPAASRRRLAHLAAAREDLRIVGFTPRPEAILRAADRVVAMGGYNTVCEAVSLRKPLLVIPRVRPRCEQLVRAERFADLGLLETLHPDRLSAEVLSEWLRRDLRHPTDVREVMDFEGLQRIPRLLGELLAGGPVRGIPRSASGMAGKDAGALAGEAAPAPGSPARIGPRDR